MHLDVLAAGQAHDAAGLVAVERDLAVLLLQADADALRDEVGDDRADDREDLQTVVTPSIESLKCVAMRSELAAAQRMA